MTARARPQTPIDDVPMRDQPYESFGEQGVGLSTYGEDPSTHRGAEGVTLGESLGERAARGPKGWERRDERIREDVRAHLAADGHGEASDLEVIVHHGEVTLRGTVNDRAQRLRALHVARHARGVIEIVDDIHIAQQR